MCPTIAIGPQTLSAHISKFPEAAASKTDHEALVKITEIMAMIVIDLLGGADVLKAAKMEFWKYSASGYLNS